MNDKRTCGAGPTTALADRSPSRRRVRPLIAVLAAIGLMASSLTVAGAQTTDTERRDQLEAALVDVDGRIADTTATLSQLDEDRSDLADERTDLDGERAESTTRLDESNQAIERLGAQQASLADNIAAAEERRKGIDGELATLATDRLGPAAVRDEFAILLYTTGDPRLSSIMDEVVTGNAHLDDAHDRTIFTMVFGASMDRLSAVDAEIEAALARRATSEKQRDDLVLAQSEVIDAIADERVKNGAVSQRVELLAGEIERLDRAIAEVDERTEAAKASLTGLQDDRRAIRTELDEVNERLERVRAAELAAAREAEQARLEAERVEQARRDAETAASVAEQRRLASAEETASASTTTGTPATEGTRATTSANATSSTSNQAATAGRIAATLPSTTATSLASLAVPGAAIIGSGDADAADPTSAPTGDTRGAGRGVLTGLGSGPNRAALAVKIDNSPRARPQTGINQADVVFEELVEGGLTRLVAVFHSNDPSKVGPIRSGRTSDIHILGNLNRPLLAFSGANPGVLREFAESSLTLAGTNQAGAAYSRNSSRRAPHNLYATTSRLRSVSGAGVPRALFDYRSAGATTPSTAQNASGVSIAFGAVRVDYAWDGAGWARSTSGKAHSDSAGVRVAPENVVVRFSNYRPSQVDSRSPEVIFSGSGTVWVFTAGKLIQGSWSQSNDGASTTYTDRAGRPIQLTPGRTWVALAEPGTARLG